MKIPCSIAKDLMPLYHDGVCSDETKAAVEEHLDDCASCRELYGKLSGADYIERSAFDEERSETLAASYRYFRRRSIMKAALLAILALAAAALIFFGIKVYRSWPVYPQPMKQVETLEELKAETEKAGLRLLYPEESALNSNYFQTVYSLGLDNRTRYANATDYTISWKINGTETHCSLRVDTDNGGWARKDMEIKGVPVSVDKNFDRDSGSASTVYVFYDVRCRYELTARYNAGSMTEEERAENEALIDGIFADIINGMLP